ASEVYRQFLRQDFHLRGYITFVAHRERERREREREQTGFASRRYRMNRRDFQKSLALGAGALLLSRDVLASGHAPILNINGERINRHLRELSEFGKNPQGGVSRVAYTEFDKQGREYVMQRMRAAQLDVSMDAAGNIIGRRAGTVAGLKPLMFGSHIDSVPEGGNYDGTVGSLGAIEVAQTMAEQKLSTRHPLEVIVFQNEEAGKHGSRMISGEFQPKDFELTNASGKNIRAGLRFLGGNPDRLAEARRKPGDIAGYLELHIEQGGTLERDSLHIGEVEGIVGINWWNVEVTGTANHAGTTPMDQRQDALVGAARFVDMVHTTARTMAGRQVATVGRMQAFPGARNVIPARVSTSLEIRDLDAQKMDRLFQMIQAEAQKIGQATGTRIAFEQAYASSPSMMDARIRGLIRDSARELGLSSRPMPSGAGHDAQSISTLAPAGMIFLPSVKGISHAPQEFSHPHDIINGVNVLLHALLKLDQAAWLSA
ncbi:MAG: Zn-dependent hydrolase, partial [Longimicrobiales bacterium]